MAIAKANYYNYMCGKSTDTNHPPIIPKLIKKPTNKHKQTLTHMGFAAYELNEKCVLHPPFIANHTNKVLLK